MIILNNNNAPRVKKKGVEERGGRIGEGRKIQEREKRGTNKVVSKVMWFIYELPLNNCLPINIKTCNSPKRSGGPLPAQVHIISKQGVLPPREKLSLVWGIHDLDTH